MARKSGSKTAVVKGGYLYTVNEDTTGLKVGSSEWSAWVDRGETFYFDGDNLGAFTARAEMRRNGLSWYGFKSINGKIKKAYIGRSGAITIDRLKQVASKLN